VHSHQTCHQKLVFIDMLVILVYRVLLVRQDHRVIQAILVLRVKKELQEAADTQDILEFLESVAIQDIQEFPATQAIQEAADIQVILESVDIQDIQEFPVTQAIQE